MDTDCVFLLGYTGTPASSFTRSWRRENKHAHVKRVLFRSAFPLPQPFLGGVSALKLATLFVCLCHSEIETAYSL